MQWQSFKDANKAPLYQGSLDKQFEELTAKLRLLPTYTPKKAEDLEERIKKKMAELQKEHGPVEEEKTEDVEEPYIDEYSSDEDVPVPETVTEWVTVIEKVPVSVTGMEEIEEPCTVFTIPVLGIPIPGTRTKKVPVTKVELQEVEKQVPATNTTTKWVKKKVKKQKVGTRTVPKTVKVSVEVPVENFRAAAKAMILEENERKIKELLENARTLAGEDC